MKCLICNEEGAVQLGEASQDRHGRKCPRCGSFYIDPGAAAEVDAHWNDRRYLLSAATRRLSDAGRHAEITKENLAELASSVRSPASVIDGVDRLMLLLADRASGYQRPVGINDHTDYPLIVARSAHDLSAFESFAQELGLLRQPGMITVKGWQRIDELRATRPKSHQAFVAMSFAAELDDVFEHGLKPGIEAYNYYQAFRVDRAQHNGKIDDKIVAEIRASGLVVADFTFNRAGVYYEAGYAQGLGLPVIWTCRTDSVDDLHFDTRQYNHIVWASPSELMRRLDERIRATVLSPLQS